MIDRGGPGALPGREISLEDLPTGSIVYVGRGSFRMEAVCGEGLFLGRDEVDERRRGVVQAVERVVTAPYGQSPGERTGVDRLPSSATWRAPDLQSLFGSQDAVAGVLSAPTEFVPLPEPRQTVVASRVALAALGAIVFVCGAVIGTAATHRAPAGDIAAVVEPQPAAAIAPEPLAVAMPAAPEVEAAPLTIEVPEPVKISARKRPAARRAIAASTDAVARPAVDATEKAPAKAAWVDPFAD